jgi:hypothetical protein
MKPSSWDKQPGLAFPLEPAARQSNQTNNPSKNVAGLDVSHHTHAFPKGRRGVFSLTSSFIGQLSITSLLSLHDHFPSHKRQTTENARFQMFPYCSLQGRERTNGVPAHKLVQELFSSSHEDHGLERNRTSLASQLNAFEHFHPRKRPTPCLLHNLPYFHQTCNSPPQQPEEPAFTAKEPAALTAPLALVQVEAF